MKPMNSTKLCAPDVIQYFPGVTIRRTAMRSLRQMQLLPLDLVGQRRGREKGQEVRRVT